MYLKVNISIIWLYWKENQFYVIKVHTIPIYNDVVLKKKSVFLLQVQSFPPTPSGRMSLVSSHFH